MSRPRAATPVRTGSSRVSAATSSDPPARRGSVSTPGAPRRQPGPGDLTDAQWSRLRPLLAEAAPSRRGGRPRFRSRRVLIDAIRWRFREGSRWDRLPPRYGPHQTAYALFNKWRKDGTWERLVVALGGGPDAHDILPWTRHKACSSGEHTVPSLPRQR